MADLDGSLEERPTLRPVEQTVLTIDGDRYLRLRDPSDAELPPVVVSLGAAAVLRLLDGTRTVAEIARWVQGGGAREAEIQAFLEQLDAAGYLEGERALARQRARTDAFAALPVRPAVHAGGAYPGDVVDLPGYLAAGYCHPEGPGALPRRSATPPPPPRGAIAPHVDLHRGAPTYAWTYRALGEAQPADLYVVLGTCHTPVEGSFAACRKPYDTPLGAVPTDLGFLQRVQRAWGRDLFAGELSHQSEHSIEFQAVYLRSLGLAGEGAAPMVAILCDSLHSLVMPRFSPRDIALVADFVAALQTAIREDGRRVTVIAAVDLAHIGPFFGDPWTVDRSHLERVAAEDHETLRLALTADPESYYRSIVRDGDARRICGFTPIYLLSELMAAEGRSGSLLRYTQWVDTDGSSSVTFASAIYP